jgi:hypothetical protein
LTNVSEKIKEAKKRQSKVRLVKEKDKECLEKRKQETD